MNQPWRISISVLIGVVYSSRRDSASASRDFGDHWHWESDTVRLARLDTKCCCLWKPKYRPSISYYTREREIYANEITIITEDAASAHFVSERKAT